MSGGAGTPGHLGDWLARRIELGTWPCARALETSPATEARVRNQSGVVVDGVNFGSQDYLGLASHPSVHDAAIRALADYGPHAFSNALSPIQTGIVHEALRIVRSEEGDELRPRSAANIEALRRGFVAQGLECYGNPSSIVPVGVGDEGLAKLTARALERRGLSANHVEYPAVARGRSRFRFQVMSTHTPEQIDRARRIFADSLAEAREQLAQ